VLVRYKGKPGAQLFLGLASLSPCFCRRYGDHASTAVLASAQYSISGAVNSHGRSDTYGYFPIFCGSLLSNTSCLGRVC